MKKINRGTKRSFASQTLLRKLATFAVILFATVTIVYAHENPCKRHSTQTLTIGNHKTSVSLLSVLINPFVIFPTSYTNTIADKHYHNAAFHYRESSENTAAFVATNWAMPASSVMTDSDEQTVSDFDMEALSTSILPQNASIAIADNDTNSDFNDEQVPQLKVISAENLEAADQGMTSDFTGNN